MPPISTTSGTSFVMEADGLRQTFDRERTVGINLLVAGFVGAIGRVDQVLWTESNSAINP